jgi:hypothetical protein
MELQLTQQEQALLTTILRERQRELLHEIARTDTHEFRRSLRETEVTLESLLHKVMETPASTAA